MLKHPILSLIYIYINIYMYQIAHRGYCDLHKDNTMAAFQAAIDHNFKMIELDIVLTKDNEIIVYHDTHIGDNLIRNLNYTEIVALDADIITIEQFFAAIDHNKTSIYLDLKGDEFICIYLHKFLSNLKNIRNILIGSFNTLSLERLHGYSRLYNLGLITENTLNNDVLDYYVKKYNLAFVSFHWTALNHKSIRFLHLKSVNVFTYTCKNESIRKFMCDYDLDGIVTNYKISYEASSDESKNTLTESNSSST